MPRISGAIYERVPQVVWLKFGLLRILLDLCASSTEVATSSILCKADKPKSILNKLFSILLVTHFFCPLVIYVLLTRNFNVVIFIHEYIFRLQIPVTHPLLMTIFNCIENLFKVPKKNHCTMFSNFLA